MIKAKTSAKISKFAVYAAAIVTIDVLVFIVGYILLKGVPHLTPELFSFEYTSENVSLMPALINTITITGLSLLIAVLLS